MKRYGGKIIRRIPQFLPRSEATKQSILSLRGLMDCFAEPVIGRAFARPVGSQRLLCNELSLRFEN
jgi:hypothetical protein